MEKESIRTVETVNGETIEVPQKGIICDVKVDNLENFIDEFTGNPRWLNYDKGPFDILHSLEKQVRGIKPRKLSKCVLSTYKGDDRVSEGEAMFYLVGFEKGKEFEGEERYVAIYTYTGTCS